MCRKETTPRTELDAEVITGEILVLQSLLHHCRSVFPTIRNDLVGQNEFSTAPYYQQRGYAAQIRLAEPITEEFVEHNRRLGKWINENALIRLHGILDSYHLVSPIVKSHAGCQEVDLLRRMRNVMTKTPLNYKPTKGENVDLRQRLIEHFKLPECDIVEGELPTPIDHVVDPIFRSSCEYVVAYCATHNNALPRRPNSTGATTKQGSGRR